MDRYHVVHEHLLEHDVDIPTLYYNRTIQDSIHKSSVIICTSGMGIISGRCVVQYMRNTLSGI